MILGTLAVIAFGPLILIVAFGLAVALIYGIVIGLLFLVTAASLLAVTMSAKGTNVAPTILTLSEFWLFLIALGCLLYFLKRAAVALEAGAARY